MSVAWPAAPREAPVSWGAGFALLGPVVPSPAPLGVLGQSAEALTTPSGLCVISSGAARGLQGLRDKAEGRWMALVLWVLCKAREEAVGPSWLLQRRQRGVLARHGTGGWRSGPVRSSAAKSSAASGCKNTCWK